jgi:ribokinase
LLTVVGNTTIDIFVRGVTRLPERAEDEFSNANFVMTNDRVVPTLGGNGANSAYVSASLGEIVRLWSALGADPFGDMILGWLHGRNVDTTSVRIMPDAGTSTTIVITDEQLRRHTYHYLGASGLFEPRARVIGGGGEDWLLVTGYTLIPRWRGEHARELLRVARGRGINTALDFGPFVGQPVTASELAGMLNWVGVLLCNKFELEQASGLSMEEGALWALDQGVEVVVVKMSARGSKVFDDSNRQGILVPGFEVEALGTVGAGDSFNSGFLYARNKGMSLEDSARFGNATAAMVVSSQRGVLDAPNEQAVREFLARRA